MCLRIGLIFGLMLQVLGQQNTDVTTLSPLTYCQRRAQVGRFLLENTYCKKYVYCYFYNNNWRGQIYSCPGNTYFNSTIVQCGLNQPTNCEISSTASTLLTTASTTITTTSSTTVSTTVSPTVSTTISSSTLPSPLTSPQLYCQSRAQVGRFLIANTYCKQYIYCYFYNNNWRGQIYSCPGNTYFNSTIIQCGLNEPTNCEISSTTSTASTTPLTTESTIASTTASTTASTIESTTLSTTLSVA